MRQTPQNIEAEKSTLGSMLIDKEAAISVGGIISEESFYNEKHKHIFSAIMAVADSGSQIDFLLVSEELRKRGLLESVGGTMYITSLANCVPTSANAEFYAQQVQESYLKRQLIVTANKIANLGYSEQVEAAEACDEAERILFAITQKRTSKDYETMHNIIVETVTHLEKLYTAKKQITGIPTGFRTLDLLTAGWQPSDLIIIAARPSMGKTTFTLDSAQCAAIKHNIPVGIFSLEMSRLQLGMKLMASHSGIDSQSLRIGNISEDNGWQRISYAASKLGSAAIYLDDTPGISVNEVRAKARRMKAEHNIGLVVVDYLQLMSTKGKIENRQQEVAEISRSLKALARELDIPVIACSQLSRATEQRSDKRPNLADLRESGSLEQDADIVAFLYRDDYYNPNTEKRNITEIIVAKHRNGPTGTVELYFQKELSKFTELERHRAPKDERREYA